MRTNYANNWICNGRGRLQVSTSEFLNKQWVIHNLQAVFNHVHILFHYKLGTRRNILPDVLIYPKQIV